MRVFVFDPGLTTGVAMCEVGDSRTRNEELTLAEIRASMQLRHIKFPNEQYGTLKLFDMMAHFHPDVIVGEDFRLFPDVAHTPDPRGTAPDRILAMFDLLVFLYSEFEILCAPYGHVSTLRYHNDKSRCPPAVVKQMPGERTIVTDDWLRRHELWRTPKQIEGAVTGDKNHAMDALRHLIVWLRKYNTGRAVA